MKNIKVEAKVVNNVDGKSFISTMSTGIRVSDYYEAKGYPDHANSNPEVRGEDRAIMTKLDKRFGGHVTSWKRI